jgi:hypothetical protein
MLHALGADGGEVLLDSRTPDLMSRVVPTEAVVECRDGFLRAHLKRGKQGRLVVRLAASRVTNLGGRTRLEVVLRAAGPIPALVNILALDDAGNSVASSRGIRQGETVTNRVAFLRRFPVQIGDKLRGLKNHFPGGFGTAEQPWTFVDPSSMATLAIQAIEESGADIELLSIQAAGAYQTPPWLAELTPDGFFPFVDPWGQFRHAHWPEKILSDEDLARRTHRERLALEADPRPSNWNRFGGWQDGPRLQATGHFRVERVGGRFTLVDPEGRLFFSIGLTTVTSKFAASPVTDREDYFQLPRGGDAISVFLQKNTFRSWQGFYANRDFQQFSFSEANLFRKYGDSYALSNRELIHRRLPAWGINSIGAWGEEPLLRMGKTVYFAMLAPDAPKVATVAKLVDIYHPDFEAKFASHAAAWKFIRQDPACAGIFFNNEIHWGESGEATVKAILKAPPGQAWRQRLEALMGREGFDGDLNALGEGVYRDYYETIHRLVKKYFPEKLFFGQREAWGWADNARSRHHSFVNADVFSANLYHADVAWVAPPRGIEKPILIGEFHFGASDTGLGAAMGAETQADRARAYRHYLGSALDNPWVVGAHWFQYGDQPVSGRFDGESINTGFVTVGDIPYQALVATAREVGEAMYARRSRAPALSAAEEKGTP